MQVSPIQISSDYYVAILSRRKENFESSAAGRE